MASVRDGEQPTAAYWPLTKSLLQLAAPSAFSYFLNFALQVVSIISVGHLGEIELGAAGIGNMVANVTGYCVGMGLCMALDTLCSNAFGARQFALVGLHAQRAIAVLTLLTPLIAGVWASTETILRAVGLSEVAERAGHWTTVLIIGLWPALANDAMKRYLQCQGIIWPMIASTVLCLPIHIAMTYFLVFRTSLAFTGAALATALSNWTLLLSLIGFTRLRSWRRARQYSALPQPFVELTGTHSAGGASGLAGAGTGLPMAASNLNADAFEASESSDLERFRGGGSALSMHGVLSPEDDMINGGSAGGRGSFAATLRAARLQTNFSLPIDDGGGDDDDLDHKSRLGFAMADDAATRRATRLQSQFSLPIIGGGGSSGGIFDDDDDDDHDDDDNRLGFAMDDDDDLVAMATGAALGVSPIASPTVSPRSRSLQFSPPSATPFSALMSPSAPSLSSSASARSSSALRSKSSKRTTGAASFKEDALGHRSVASDTNSGDTTVDTAAAADAFHDAAAENTWPPLSCDVFRGWGEFFRLGAPAALSLIIEWGSYEVTAWAAGRLGATSLATHTVFMQTCAVWYMVPIGIAVATSTLIGQALGGGRAHEARQLAVIGLAVETAYGLVNGAVFIFFLRRAWPALFSTSAAVVDLAAAVFPVMYFYGLFDATKCVSMGILRGAGRPTATVFGNALACLAVGAPLSYLLAFYWELGLLGLWAAMTTAWLAATAVYTFIIFARTDWEHEAAMAAERNLRSATGAGGDAGGGDEAIRSPDGELP